MATPQLFEGGLAVDDRGKVRFVNVERENISQIVMYAKTKSFFVTVEPEISINDKTKIISQIKKITTNFYEIFGNLCLT